MANPITLTPLHPLYQSTSPPFFRHALHPPYELHGLVMRATLWSFQGAFVYSLILYSAKDVVHSRGLGPSGTPRYRVK